MDIDAGDTESRVETAREIGAARGSGRKQSAKAGSTVPVVV